LAELFRSLRQAVVPIGQGAIVTRHGAAARHPPDASRVNVKLADRPDGSSGMSVIVDHRVPSSLGLTITLHSVFISVACLAQSVSAERVL
jgi:hypothetical protein